MASTLLLPDGAQLLPPRALGKHAKACSRKGCKLCCWNEKGPGWQRTTLIPDSKTPWLACVRQPLTKTKFKLRFGCVVCNFFCKQHQLHSKGSSSSQVSDSKKSESITSASYQRFANFEICWISNQRRMSAHLRQHTNTNMHTRALRHWMGPRKEPLSAQVGPSEEEWKMHLEALRKGQSQRNGGSSSDLTALMRWTLTEAHLESMRKRLAQCLCLVLLRDERQGKLCIRFRACGPDMAVTSGLLGIHELQGKTAKDLVLATEKVVEHFATRNLLPPRNFRGPTKNALDNDLFMFLRKQCTMVVTDCASNELLAQQLSRGQRGGVSLHGGDESITSLFPNAKIIGRDRAHACQRLIERPWGADPLLKALLEEQLCVNV